MMATAEKSVTAAGEQADVVISRPDRADKHDGAVGGAVKNNDGGVYDAAKKEASVGTEAAGGGEGAGYCATNDDGDDRASSSSPRAVDPSPSSPEAPPPPSPQRPPRGDDGGSGSPAGPPRPAALQAEMGTTAGRPPPVLDDAIAAAAASRQDFRPGAVPVEGLGVAPPPTRLRRSDPVAAANDPWGRLLLPPGGEGTATSDHRTAMMMAGVLETAVEATLVVEEEEENGDDDGDEGGIDDEPGPHAAVEPYDYAHAVAIPTNMVIPVPEEEGRGVGVGGGSDDDFIDDDARTGSRKGGGREGRQKRSLREALIGDRRVCATIAVLLVAAVVAVAVAVSTAFSGSGAGAGGSSSSSSVPPSPTDRDAPDADGGDDVGTQSGEGNDDGGAAGTPVATPDPAATEQARAEVVRLNEVRDILAMMYDMDEGKGCGLSSSVLFDDDDDDSTAPPSYHLSALQWTAHIDPLRLNIGDFKQLRQRYVLAVVFFATGARLPVANSAQVEKEEGMKPASPPGEGSTAASSWIDRFHFLTGRDECLWHEEGGGFWGARGAHCDDDGRVVNLSLFQNNLTGILPEEVCLLSELGQLRLLHNAIGGTIPTTYGSLPKVYEFMISVNDLTGTLPTELGMLKDVEVLGIRSNHLTGTLPTEFGNLRSVKILTIRDNRLTGTIPPELGRLLEHGNVDRAFFQFNNISGSMNFLCPPRQEAGKSGGGYNWTDLESDCLEKVECGCCTLCR